MTVSPEPVGSRKESREAAPGFTPFVGRPVYGWGMSCQHQMADLARLAKGERCPSCHRTLEPEEILALDHRRRQLRLRALRLATDALAAEIADLKRRLDRLEGKVSTPERPGAKLPVGCPGV